MTVNKFWGFFMSRRKFVAGCAASLATPYFFSIRTIRADTLNDGLVANVTRVSNNLSIPPAGPQRGGDVQVAGGGTVFARSVNGQGDLMARSGGFTQIQNTTQHTRSVCANPTGYFFTRFQQSYRNCCLPLGVVSNQGVTVYAGAMTLLEGPNLVALRVLTDELIKRNYTSQQVMDFVWPLRPCRVDHRERALITFSNIQYVKLFDGRMGYADRDVLSAKSADCALQYSYTDKGAPDGGGRAALIINQREEFRVEFQYDMGHLRA
jgi:hypothetical protein